MANIIGTNGPDVLNGIVGQNNYIVAREGDDVVTGAALSDIILGNEGDDVLDGGAGNDNIFGGRGNDSVVGGSGNDTLRGDRGDDTLNGGDGDDTFVLRSVLGGESVFEIEDFDIARQDGDETYNDTLRIRDAGGKNIVFQETASGAVAVSINGVEIAEVKGSNGTITATELVLATTFFPDSQAPAAVSLFDADGDVIPLVQRGTLEADTIVAVPGIGQRIEALAGDDTVTGSEMDDFILGRFGDDSLNGAGGNDTVFGNKDDDVLFGGAGDDILAGGEGDDQLTGGEGADRFSFNSAQEGADVVFDYDAAEGDVVLVRNPEGALVYDATSGILSDDGGVIATFFNTPDALVFL